MYIFCLKGNPKKFLIPKVTLSGFEIQISKIEYYKSNKTTLCYEKQIK
jgi:hypothetical protein